MKFKFDVIDPNTGTRPDPTVCAGEEWLDCDGTSYLMPKKWSYAVDEEGVVVVMDSCGNYAYPPEGRFHVRMKVVTE